MKTGGLGAFRSNLPSQRRARWSAATTGLLATTNGDGIEKTLCSILLPANTLAYDGALAEVVLCALYYNNTTATQTPQFGLACNNAADWILSGTPGASALASTSSSYLVRVELKILRKSSSTANINGTLIVQVTSASDTVASFGTRYGSFSVNAVSRPIYALGVSLDHSAANTIHFKGLLAAYGTPALHQITGLEGYAVLVA